MTILLTGAAGFIGFHVTRALLERGNSVMGVDNLNDYYDPKLKEARLKILSDYDQFQFVKTDVRDGERISSLFRSAHPSSVVHLAAQAGVRYSIDHPHVYVQSNIDGFLHILEGCRQQQVEHLLYASSSSVYGGNTNLPFSVQDRVDHPISLYAATKKANELMAHAYSHLFRIPTTGLRFFTVYGPWGRPDMALFLFTKSIMQNKPIQIFNHGRMSRDFTYIDDVVEAVVRLIRRIPTPNPEWREGDPGSKIAPYSIYNIGNNQPVDLQTFIQALEKKLETKAEKIYLQLQAGDVPDTYASVEELIRDIGFQPQTSVEEGISNFVDWYKAYYGEAHD